MNELLAALDTGAPLSGSIAGDATAFLSHHNALHTIGHSARVAAAARELAEQCGVNPVAAETAGWLHDISTLIPNERRVAHAEAWSISVLPEERQVPMIIHQKLSAYIAEHLFGVADRSILNAIGCHTTLRSGASLLDKIVFIADKVKWMVLESRRMLLISKSRSIVRLMQPQSGSCRICGSAVPHSWSSIPI